MMQTTIPFFRVTFGDWLLVKDGHPAALRLYERHYSAYQYADGRKRKLFLGPGEKLVLITRDGKALFAWRKFIDDSGETGVNCAVFRNESPILSSALILQAERQAWARWPGERLYTYVSEEKTRRRRSRHARGGRCFEHAGWSYVRTTPGGLLVLEKLPEIWADSKK